MSIQIGNTSIKEIYIGSTKIVEGYVGSTKFLKSVPALLTADLNNSGEDQTSTFRSAYSDWNNFKVFKTNVNRTTGTWNNFLRNIGNVSANFTFWYYLDCYRNSTSKAYGQVQYNVDSSNLVSKVGGWTSAGLDSQNPRYQKSRWRSATVNVSKGGDLKIIFGQPNSDIWYTGAMYWAVDESLVSAVTNSAT